MRAVFIFVLSIGFLFSKAQTFLPMSGLSYPMWQSMPLYFPSADSTHTNHQLYFNTYSAISTGFFFSGGGTASFFSAPVGIQMTRPLNNNVSAFATISVAPTLFSFNNAFMNPAFNKSYPGAVNSNAYGFGINPAVQMGLMYTNDAKTFSISGSVGVERGTYPVYFPERTNIRKQ
jgi:hypothetical protein